MKTNRIPSLDGLRAISIIMVVLGHVFKEEFANLNIANLGVRFFFIISSYLIVGILYNNVLNNNFSVKTFYFKRILRTFPAFYFYLIVIYFLLNYLNIFDLSQFWRAPVYLENYHPRQLWTDTQWFVGHSWSLAVEEQFYIVIAIIFYFLNKQMISKKTVFNIFIFILILSPIIRMVYMYVPSIPITLKGSIHRSFETVFDSIAIGGVLALLPKSKLIKSKTYLFFKDRIGILAVLILLFQFLNSPLLIDYFGYLTKMIYNSFGLTLMHICIALLIIITINHPKKNIFTNMLNNQIMVTIGLWSYSIYLWQQVWLYDWNLNILLKLMGIILCSIFSYYIIEKPALKFRNRILRKKAN